MVVCVCVCVCVCVVCGRGGGGGVCVCGTPCFWLLEHDEVEGVLVDGEAGLVHPVARHKAIPCKYHTARHGVEALERQAVRSS